MMNKVNIGSIYTGKRELRVHVYPEFKDCFLAECRPEGETWDISEIQSVGGVDTEGNESEHSIQEVLEGAEQMNYWGFCDQNTGDVHIWFRPECSLSELIFLLGHEQGHLAKKYPDDEERNAEEYAEIAQLAYLMAMKVQEAP